MTSHGWRLVWLILLMTVAGTCSHAEPTGTSLLKCRAEARQVAETTNCPNRFGVNIFENKADFFPDTVCINANDTENYGTRARNFSTRICEISKQEGCRTQDDPYACAGQAIQQEMLKELPKTPQQTNQQNQNNNTEPQKNTAPPNINSNSINDAKAPPPEEPDQDHKKNLSEIQGELARQCIACPIVARIFAASMLYGKEAFELFGKPVSRILGVALGLWILWQAGLLFNPFGPLGKAKDISNTIFIRIILVMGMTIALSSSTPYQAFWNYIYKPVVYGGIELIDSMNNLAVENDTAALKGISGQKDCGPGVTYTKIEKLDADQTAAKEKLECATHNLQRMFTYGLAAGIWLWEQGRFFSGALMTIAYLLPPLIFAVMVIDAVVRWTFISALAPGFMACYVFPKTRHIATTALKGLIESSVGIACLGIVAVLTSGMIESALKTASARFQEIQLPEWAENSPSAKGAVNAVGVSDPTKPADSNKSGTIPAWNDKPLKSVDANACPFRLNVNPGSGCTITDTYGFKAWRGRVHRGVDYGCTAGRGIVAAADGTYYGPIRDAAGFGWYNIVKHPNGFETWYGHTVAPGSPPLKSGTPVKAGQVVGVVASMQQLALAGGKTTGPHLHFEVHDPAGNRINPTGCLNGSGYANPGEVAGQVVQGVTGAALGFGGNYQPGQGFGMNLPSFKMSAMEYWLLLFPALIAFMGMKVGTMEAQRMLGGSGLVTGLATAVFAGASAIGAQMYSTAGAANKFAGNAVSGAINRSRDKEGQDTNRDPEQAAREAAYAQEWDKTANMTDEERKAWEEADNNWEHLEDPVNRDPEQAARENVFRQAAEGARDAVFGKIGEMGKSLNADYKGPAERTGQESIAELVVDTALGGIAVTAMAPVAATSQGIQNLGKAIDQGIRGTSASVTERMDGMIRSINPDYKPEQRDTSETGLLKLALETTGNAIGMAAMSPAVVVVKGIQTLQQLPQNAAGAVIQLGDTLQQLPGRINGAVLDKKAQMLDDLQRWWQHDAAMDIFTGAGKALTVTLQGSAQVADIALQKIAASVGADPGEMVSMRDAFQQGYNIVDGNPINRTRSSRPEFIEFDKPMGYREQEAATFAAYEVMRYQALASQETSKIYMGKTDADSSAAIASIYGAAATEWLDKLETILEGGKEGKELVSKMQAMKKNDYSILVSNQEEAIAALGEATVLEGAVAADMKIKGFDEATIQSAQGVTVAFGLNGENTQQAIDTPLSGKKSQEPELDKPREDNTKTETETKEETEEETEEEKEEETGNSTESPTDAAKQDDDEDEEQVTVKKTTEEQMETVKRNKQPESQKKRPKHEDTEEETSLFKKSTRPKVKRNTVATVLAAPVLAAATTLSLSARKPDNNSANNKVPFIRRTSTGSSKPQTPAPAAPGYQSPLKPKARKQEPAGVA